jgi:hypothetical protein
MKTEELRERVHHGLIEYGINVVYLTLVFAAFTEFRRLILAAHGITYTDYWVALIKGLILGKVIMVLGVFRLGRRVEAMPLVYPTFYKAVVFTLLVGVFTVVEFEIKGLWAGGGVARGLVDLSGKGFEELTADSLVVFVAFIPFFAVKELGRVLGEERIRALFFRKRDEGAQSPESAAE